MSTSPPDGAQDATGNIPEYTVSELSGALKRTVEGAYAHVRVRGEISGFKRAASGHLYLDLKDEGAVLNAVCWRGVAGRLRFAPEDGLEVVATGKLSTYAQRSNYQLVIESLEPAGAGALMALLEERRNKLAGEGLFDPARKQPLPYLPDVIGVVTSPTGAVISDILHRLRDRFPRHVLLWPVLVQGEGAAEQIAGAIEGFNGLTPGGEVPRPDLLIVARGGGSLEDLWAFNEEVVVRAAAASAIPLISAVGHETDTTLIDFASDLRAPTPTAAAEFAVPVRADLSVSIAELDRRQQHGLFRLIDEATNRLKALARSLPSAAELLGLRQQRFDELSERLPRALTANTGAHRRALAEKGGGLRRNLLHAVIERRRFPVVDATRRLITTMDRVLADTGSRLDNAARLLESLSYQSVLARGYAVVRDAGGTPVISSHAVQPADRLGIEFKDGHIQAVAEGGTEKPPPRAKKKTQSARRPKSALRKGGRQPGGQGDLF